MNSIAPWQAGHPAAPLARSEAFAEDLQEAESTTPRPPRWLGSRLGAALLLAVPLAVAVLGGVVAFFHTVG